MPNSTGIFHCRANVINVEPSCDGKWKVVGHNTE